MTDNDSLAVKADPQSVGQPAPAGQPARPAGQRLSALPHPRQHYRRPGWGLFILHGRRRPNGSTPLARRQTGRDQTSPKARTAGWEGPCDAASVRG